MSPPTPPPINITHLLAAESHKGSISAEHGLGLQKTQHLHYSKSQVSRDWMRRVKLLFDDKGIMNPGKVVAVGQT